MKLIATCGFTLAFLSGLAQAPKQGVTKGNSNASGYLESRKTYLAKGSDTVLRIWNPTIRALNNRTEFGDTRLFGYQSLLALPKGSFGYANGQIWLRPTGATSTGGNSGHSSVGTGSSSGGIGSASSALGVNGKNPYAGPAMWGSANGLNLPDSVLRRNPISPGKKVSE